MAPLTDDRPKPLIEVAGKSLLHHALDPAREAGLSPIVVNAHYLADQLATALRGQPDILSREEPEILDTGGGLKAALPKLPGKAVFTMNSDAVWTGSNPFVTLRDAWSPAEMDALVLCVPMARAEGRADRGDFTIDDTARVTRGPGHVYTGAQIIRSDLVARHPERVFSFNILWDEMIARGRLFAAIHPGKWCDVGRPTSIPLAEAMIDV
ncbi:MAG: nucleotidyltransferase family protein [Pseudomonadota bacterium]